MEEDIIKAKDFTDQSLQGSSYQNVIFAHCNFTKSDWRDAKFCDCHFMNCNLSLVKMDNCRLQDVVFEECKLVGLEFYKTDKQFLFFKILRSIIHLCNFSDLNLKRSSFHESKLKECYFTNTGLIEADFSNTDLSATIFHQCNLTKADFRNAKNYFIDPTCNCIKKAHFSLPEAVSLLHCFDVKLD